MKETISNKVNGIKVTCNSDIYLINGMENKKVLEFDGQYESLEKSLKVLDFVATLSEGMTVKEATDILLDAIKVLPQLTLML